MIGLVVLYPNHRGMTWTVAVIVNRPSQLLLNKEQPDRNDLRWRLEAELSSRS